MSNPMVPYAKAVSVGLRLFPHTTRRLIPRIVMSSSPVWYPEYHETSEKALREAGLYTPDLLEKVARLPAEFMGDLQFMAHAPLKAVQSLPLTMTGLSEAQLRSEFESGHGTLLGCANFGCFYAALMACRGLIDDILIILGSEPSRSLGVKERIEAMTGMRIRLMTINSHSSIAIARQLARGGVVATMLDTYISTAPKYVVDFMGRPAATPSSIYRLAEKQSARIFPLFTYRRGSGVDIELCPPINASELGAEQAARVVNRCIESRIMREPDQWMMWPQLLTRWAAV